MIYEFEVRTQTTDTQASPKKTVLKLTEGVIHQLDIVSYKGAMGYLYVSLKHGLYQVWPTNPEKSHRLGGEPFSFEERYKLTKPAELVLYSYLGSGATNYHDVLIRIAMLRQDEITGVTLNWDEMTEKLYKE